MRDKSSMLSLGVLQAHESGVCVVSVQKKTRERIHLPASSCSGPKYSSTPPLPGWRLDGRESERFLDYPLTLAWPYLHVGQLISYLKYTNQRCFMHPLAKNTKYVTAGSEKPKHRLALLRELGVQRFGIKYGKQGQMS